MKIITNFDIFEKYIKNTLILSALVACLSVIIILVFFGTLEKIGFSESMMRQVIDLEKAVFTIPAIIFFISLVILNVVYFANKYLFYPGKPPKSKTKLRLVVSN